MSIEVIGADLFYGSGQRKLHALRGVSLKVPNESSCGILGLSGCGKTTLLRSIGGFETLDDGDVIICDQMVTKEPPSKRGVGYVPQLGEVFAGLTVWRNIAIAVPEGMNKKEVLLEATLSSGLEPELLKRDSVQTLSGGQKRRVAIARLVASHASVWLLDEPFNGLDAPRRRELRKELKYLSQDRGATMLVVTHDQADIEGLDVDYLAIMNNGQIEQFGTRKEVLSRPSPAARKLL